MYVTSNRRELFNAETEIKNKNVTENTVFECLFIVHIDRTFVHYRPSQNVSQKEHCCQ